MTLSRQILAGLALGIFTGLFFGERAAALRWVADGFVKLLQMMVLPYITVSIVASLGSLQPSELRTLGLRAAGVIGGLWIVALSFAFLIPLTFPSAQNASFFSTSLVERRDAFNFIDLYIPANPFNSLANNIVPAVVLFSVFLGVALVRVQHRERLLDVLQVARAAISTATRFVTRLTPYGLFAIAANAAGTMGLEQLSRLQVYLVTYVAMALLVSLWVLPGLIAALTPLRARDVLNESKDSLITACIAGDLFIVLPGLMQASRTLLGRLTHGDDEPGRLTEVIVPVSFNFPHTGKLMSLSFVLFAGWFSDTVVPLSSYPQLALAGLVTFFGSLSAAVPFLLDLFRIPADTFQLFLATGVINSRVGSLVAAVHTLTVALLVACAVSGHLRWRRGALLSYAGITGALLIAILGGTRAVMASSASHEYSKDEVLASMHLLQRPVPATVARDASPPPATTLPPLETIEARKVLRVGYLPDVAAVCVLQSARRPGGLRYRARAPPGTRDERHPGVRAGGSHTDGRAARRRLLRPGDVGGGGDDEPCPAAAVLGCLPGRDPGLRRPGRAARTVHDLGCHPRSRGADDRGARSAGTTSTGSASCCRGPWSGPTPRASSRCSTGPQREPMPWRCRPSAARPGRCCTRNTPSSCPGPSRFGCRWRTLLVATTSAWRRS